MRRQRPAAGGCTLSAAAATLLLALVGAGQAAAQQQAEWTLVTDPFAAKLPGLEVAVAGPPQQPFARPPPRTLDPHLLTDFAAQLNVLQDVSGKGDNTFTETSPQVRAGAVWRQLKQCGVRGLGASAGMSFPAPAAAPLSASQACSHTSSSELLPSLHHTCPVCGHRAQCVCGGRGRAGV